MTLAKVAEEDGGETGIRTLDTLRYTRFPSVRLQPLGHLPLGVSKVKFNTPASATLADAKNAPCEVSFRPKIKTQKPYAGHPPDYSAKINVPAFAPCVLTALEQIA